MQGVDEKFQRATRLQGQRLIRQLQKTLDRLKTPRSALKIIPPADITAIRSAVREYVAARVASAEWRHDRGALWDEHGFKAEDLGCNRLQIRFNLSGKYTPIFEGVNRICRRHFGASLIGSRQMKLLRERDAAVESGNKCREKSRIAQVRYFEDPALGQLRAAVEACDTPHHAGDINPQVWNRNTQDGALLDTVAAHAIYYVLSDREDLFRTHPARTSCGRALRFDPAKEELQLLSWPDLKPHRGGK